MICTPNWRETSNTKSEVKNKLKVSPILVNMQGHSMFNHFLNGVWCDDLLMQRTVPQDEELLIMALLTSSLPVRISSVYNRLCDIMEMWSNRFKLTTHITAASLPPWSRSVTQTKPVCFLPGWTNPCCGDRRCRPDCLLPAVQHRQGRCVRQGPGKIEPELWLHNLQPQQQQQQSLLPPEADHCTGSWTMHCVGLDCCIMDSSWIIHVSMWGCLRLIGALMRDNMQKLK